MADLNEPKSGVQTLPTLALVKKTVTTLKKSFLLTVGHVMLDQIEQNMADSQQFHKNVQSAIVERQDEGKPFDELTKKYCISVTTINR